MNKKDYETVDNLIIDEDFDKANALISKIMEQKTKSIYKQRLIEDGDLKSPEDIEKDKIEIEQPEGDEEVKTEVEDETTAEENPESSPEEIKYQFLDIQKDFDRLKAEFEKVLGTDMDSEEVVDTDTVETDIEEDCYDSDIPNENDEASPLTFANESEEDDGENLDSDENIFNDDDLNDIAESLELSTVSIDMKTPKEAGTNKSVKTDNKSFVDTKEGEKGEPIQIKSSGELKGTGRQPSPPVKNPSYKSTNVMDLKKVEKEGDKSAKLNSKEGFGKDEDDSPLSKIKR